ncbi:peptidyl-tRNA hydrolase [compost metagenome]
MTKSFPKITLEVKNEAQLKRYYDEAVAAGLPASWIVDAGRTVSNGVPTPTCVGIGPASREAIDAITKRLRVYQ